MSDIAITKMGDQPEKNIFVELYSWNHQLSHEAVFETIIILVGFLQCYHLYWLGILELIGTWISSKRLEII